MLTRPQNTTEILGKNLAAVRARIAAAARTAGRSADSITLLAVSKGHPAASIAALADTGVRNFGENYLQEALPKMAAVGREGLVWHFTGMLQSNKTRAVAESFDWVHTVDRARIAERLDAQRPAMAAPLDVCIQVRTDADSRAGGCPPADLPALFQAVCALPRLRLRGLMCLPPPGDSDAARRAQFRAVRGLFEQLRRAQLPSAPADGPHSGLDTLSMGMSDDLELAIAEGATLLRIGTALFGERPAPIAPAARAP